MAERFEYQLAKDKILVYFRNRHVRTLVGVDNDELRAAIDTGDDDAIQLLFARKTGNFKRGNER